MNSSQNIYAYCLQRLVRFGLGMFLVVAASGISTAAADTNVIDVLQAKFNAKPLFALTLDEVTDWLGKPSATFEKTNSFEIVYLNDGLRFVFEPSDLKAAKVAYLEVVLSKRTEKYGTLNPFQGNLTKGVSANWKAKKIMEEFKEWSPVDHFSAAGLEEGKRMEEFDKLRSKFLKSKGEAVTPALDYARLFARTFITIKCEQHTLIFSYDYPVTFLRSAQLSERPTKSEASR